MAEVPLTHDTNSEKRFAVIETGECNFKVVPESEVVDESRPTATVPDDEEVGCTDLQGWDDVCNCLRHILKSHIISMTHATSLLSPTLLSQPEPTPEPTASKKYRSLPFLKSYATH